MKQGEKDVSLEFTRLRTKLRLAK